MERKNKEIKSILNQTGKAALRKEAKLRRDGLGPEKRAQLSAQICRLLQEWEVFGEAESIYFYYPLGSEADLLAAAGEALRLGKQVGFPRTLGDQMEFYPVESLAGFQEGPFHVMEPKGCKPLKERVPLILTPGLAFDSAKARIGYGKAYYDRYFQRFPGACKAGICFGVQLMEGIPAEVHDISMDYLVTDTGIY